MNQIQEDKKIPDFLQDLPAQDTIQNNESLRGRLSPLKKNFVIISIAWFSFILLYIHFLLGWDALSIMLPDEFVRFLAFSIIPLMLILMLTAFVYKTYVFASQTLVLQEKLGKILYSDNENALAEMINQSLQSQIKKLADTAKHISAQNDVLKQELSTKAADFEKISASLEKCFSQNLITLNENIKNFLSEYKEASQTAQDFVNQAGVLKDTALGLSTELNPLINETVSTADYLKNMINDGKQLIEKHSADTENFVTLNRDYLQKTISLIDEKNAKLEQAFLKTADSCEEIYKRLDGGISHIENSLNTHKQLAQEQSDLLDKNSTYLDNKLGEYGKLISMEVEAMVERSSTLDTNVDNQVKMLEQAGKKVTDILDGTNQALENIVAKLESELSKLNDFIEKTESKNDEIKNAAEKITEKIGGLSMDLGLKVDDLKIRAVDAIDKFNEVNAVVKTNTMQLSESANIIVNKGREGSKSLEQQHASIVLALEKFDDIKHCFYIA